MALPVSLKLSQKGQINRPKWVDLCNSQMGQMKSFLLFYIFTIQESCHSINKDHSYKGIMKRQTFSKRDHDQCSVHKHSVSQMLGHSNRLWLLELHKAYPRRHWHRGITIVKLKKQNTTLNTQKLQTISFFVLSFIPFIPICFVMHRVVVLAHSQFNVKMLSVHPSNKDIHTQYSNNDNKYVPGTWFVASLKCPCSKGSMLLDGISLLIILAVSTFLFVS